MLQATSVRRRYCTPWRHMLHPLPPKHRRSQWLKRDLVEMNEAVLRRPYYVLKSPLDESISRNREKIRFPQDAGPQLLGEDRDARDVFQPKYPLSFDTVAPPHVVVTAPFIDRVK